MAQTKAAPRRNKGADAAKASAKKKPVKAPEADSKAKQTAALRSLNPIAKEVNERFERAAKADGQANDHRLAAALRLEEAAKLCDASKVNFKKWCEENVKQSYETVRKLLPIGRAEAEKAGEGMKLLTHAREKNKEANRAHRERSKGRPGSRDTSPAVKPLDVVETQLERIDEPTRVNFLKSRIADHGLAVVSKDEAKLLKKVKEGALSAGLEALRDAFDKLEPPLKMEFVKWAANEIGFTVVDPFEAEKPSTKDTPVEDLTDLGAFKREPKASKRKAA